MRSRYLFQLIGPAWLVLQCAVAQGQVVPRASVEMKPAPAPAVGSSAVTATSVTCPTPPNQLSFTVIPTTSQNKKTKIWTYSYKVTNSSSSQQPLWQFAIDYNPPISSITSPTGWASLKFADRNTNGWAAIGGASFPVGQADDGSVPPSPYQIAPGASLSGFSFQSPNPPASVPDFALGFAPLPAVTTEDDPDTLVDQCRSALGNFFDMAVRGVTMGPAGSILPIEIDIVPFFSPNDVDLSPTAVPIPVAILSTQSFSASAINTATAKFGPGNAPALLSPAPVIEDVNGDGLADLVLYFDPHAAAIPCGASAATLTASQSGGGTVMGTDWVSTTNCLVPTPTPTATTTATPTATPTP